MLRMVLLCRQSLKNSYNHHNPYLGPSNLFNHPDFYELNSIRNVTQQASRFLSTKARSPTHFYDTLGLTANATQKQIKAAYYELSKQCHPDINPSRDSHRKFTQISEAYETLGNVDKKRAYDRGLNNSVFDEEQGVDMTDEYFRQRAGTFRGKRPPPTGRNYQYDFDEFYRQHYAEQIAAEQKRRQYEYDRIKLAKVLEKQRAYMRTMLVIMLSFWMGGSIVVSITDMDRPRSR